MKIMDKMAIFLFLYHYTSINVFINFTKKKRKVMYRTQISLIVNNHYQIIIQKWI